MKSNTKPASNANKTTPNFSTYPVELENRVPNPRQENFYTESNEYQNRAKIINTRRQAVLDLKAQNVLTSQERTKISNYETFIKETLKTQFRFLQNLYDIRTDGNYNQNQKTWSVANTEWIKNEVAFYRALENEFFVSDQYKDLSFEAELKEREAQARAQNFGTGTGTGKDFNAQANYDFGFNSGANGYGGNAYEGYKASGFGAGASSSSAYGYAREKSNVEYDEFIRTCKNLDALNQYNLKKLLDTNPDNLKKLIDGKDLLRHVMEDARTHDLFDMVLEAYLANYISLDKETLSEGSFYGKNKKLETKLEFAMAKYKEYAQVKNASHRERRIPFLKFAVELLAAGAEGEPNLIIDFVAQHVGADFYQLIKLLKLPTTKPICIGQPLLYYWVNTNSDVIVTKYLLDAIIQCYRSNNTDLNTPFMTPEGPQSPLDVAINKQKWELATALLNAGVGNVSHAQKVLQSIPIQFSLAVSTKYHETFIPILQRPGLEFEWTTQTPNSSVPVKHHLLIEAAKLSRIGSNLLAVVINAYKAKAKRNGEGKLDLNVKDSHGKTAFDYAIFCSTHDGRLDFVGVKKLLEEGAFITANGLLDFIKREINFWLQVMYNDIRNQENINFLLDILNKYPIDFTSTYTQGDTNIYTKPVFNVGDTILSALEKMNDSNTIKIKNLIHQKYQNSKSFSAASSSSSQQAPQPASKPSKATVLFNWKAYEKILLIQNIKDFEYIRVSYISMLVENIRAYCQEDLKLDALEIYIIADHLNIHQNKEMNKRFIEEFKAHNIQVVSSDEALNKIAIPTDQKKPLNKLILIGDEKDYPAAIKNKFDPAVEIFNPSPLTLYKSKDDIKLLNLEKRNLNVMVEWRLIHVPIFALPTFIDALFNFCASTLKCATNDFKRTFKSIEMSVEIDEGKLPEVFRALQLVQKSHPLGEFIKLIPVDAWKTSHINKCVSGDIIYLVSGDSDFQPLLAQKVLEGCKVLLIHEQMTRWSFIKNPLWLASSDFMELPLLKSYRAAQLAKRAEKKLAADQEARQDVKKEVKKDVPHRLADYHKIDPGSIGLCEVQGKRPSQEDAMRSAILEGYKNIALKDQEHILLETFNDMQAIYGTTELAKDQGSCGCSTIAWYEYEKDGRKKLRANTINLGDSTAFLVIFTEGDNHPALVPLNPLLHNPLAEISAEENAKKEGKAFPVRKKPIVQMNDRLGGGLAVSRAFGDLGYEDLGMIHDPDVHTHSQYILDNQKAFIVVACDGLTEKSGLDNLFTSIKSSLNPFKMASELVEQALASGSKDNISVGVFEVEMCPKSVAVFDGHGGAEIAFSLGENFYSILQKKLADKLREMFMKQYGLSQAASSGPSATFFAAASPGNKAVEGVLQAAKKQGPAT